MKLSPLQAEVLGMMSQGFMLCQSAATWKYNERISIGTIKVNIETFRSLKNRKLIKLKIGSCYVGYYTTTPAGITAWEKWRKNERT